MQKKTKTSALILLLKEPDEKIAILVVSVLEILIHCLKKITPIQMSKKTSNFLTFDVLRRNKFDFSNFNI